MLKEFELVRRNIPLIKFIKVRLIKARNSQSLSRYREISHQLEMGMKHSLQGCGNLCRTRFKTGRFTTICNELNQTISTSHKMRNLNLELKNINMMLVGWTVSVWDYLKLFKINIKTKGNIKHYHQFQNIKK